MVVGEVVDGAPSPTEIVERGYAAAGEPAMAIAAFDDCEYGDGE